MKTFILISILASAIGRCASKGVDNAANAAAKSGAKNSDEMVQGGSKLSDDTYQNALTKAVTRSAKYLENDLNKADSNVYYENGQVVIDNTRK